LRSRKHPDALLSDPAEAAQQALSIVQGKVIARDGSQVPLHADTPCIHSDTPGTPQIARQAQSARNGTLLYQVSFVLYQLRHAGR